MKKTGIILLFVLFLFPALYPESVNAGINALRTAYANRKYNSFFKGSVNIVDAAYRELLLKIAVLLPDISNFIAVETNASYSYSINNGVSDYNLAYERILSNNNDIISLSLDTSLYSIERYLNLVKSYEYLDDKGDYDRYFILNKKVTNFYIIDKTSAYLAYPVDVNKETEEVLSGVLFKMSFNKNIKNSEKKHIIENYMKAVLVKFKSGGLDSYLK